MRRVAGLSSQDPAPDPAPGKQNPDACSLVPQTVMREGEKIATARSLRRRQTDAEKALWRLLRNRTFLGAKFRRQHAIGRYVADFVCLELKLIVELDGGQHAMNEEADRKRTFELNQLGFQVLRIWNNDMLTNPEGVLRLIEQALKSPSPCIHFATAASPASGRGSSARQDVTPRHDEDEKFCGI